MFYSNDILGRKSPLGLIWTLAHGKKMPKNKIISVDIRELCKHILEPSVPFALRLQGILINGIVCVYEKKQAYLLRDLQDMRKRVESAAAPQEDPDDGCVPDSKVPGTARARGGATLKTGKDTAKLEAITLMEWDIALGGATGTWTSGGLMEDADIAAHDLASDLFLIQSLDPSASTGRDTTTERGASTSRTLAGALNGGRLGRGAVLLPAEGDLFAVEGFEAHAEEELLAMDHANEMFDMAPDMELFGADLQDLLPPPLLEDEPPAWGGIEALEAPAGGQPPSNDLAASPVPSVPQLRCDDNGQHQHEDDDATGEPRSLANGGEAAAMDEGGVEAGEAQVPVLGGAAAKRKRGIKRRTYLPVVDPVSNMQISNSTYRDWIKDSSHIVAARARRAQTTGGSGLDGGAVGAEGSPSAKNNAVVVLALAAGSNKNGLFPASAFAGGLFGLATREAMAWGDATLAAFRLCAGDPCSAAGTAAAAHRPALGSDGHGAAAGLEDERLMFLLDEAGAARGEGAGDARRGGDATRDAREDAERAAKRAKFGELLLEMHDEAFYYDLEEPMMVQVDEPRGDGNDAVGGLAFGGDIETERLRARAPAPGSADGAGGPHFRVSNSTPGSSLGGLTGALRSAHGARRRGGAGSAAGAESEQPSGSETSLLVPESGAMRTGRGARRLAAGGSGELDRMLVEEEESPLGRPAGGRATGGSLRDLLPDVEEEVFHGSEMEGDQAAVPSSQWQLLVESGTQHRLTQLPLGPEASMTQATHTAIKVFRSRLLEASRRRASAVSFLAISNRLSRMEAAKAFYQVCVTHANGYIRATQREPYGDIAIAAGPKM